MLSFNDLAHRLALQISQYSSPTRGCFRVVSNASPSEIAEDLGRTASAVRARAHAKRIALGRSRFIAKTQAK